MTATATRSIRSAPSPCARSAALRQHASLVQSIARRLRARLPASVALDELVQAGMIGLHDALVRYESDRGASFSTYASRRIEGAMLDALRVGDLVPREVRARQREVQAKLCELEHRLLRTPSAQELASELGCSVLAVHRSMAEVQSGGQLAERERSDEPEPAPDELLTATDEHADPLHRLQRRQREAALGAAFEMLDGRERQLMEMLYDQGLDHSGAASVLGVTPSRVSQLHSAVVAKLRRRLRDW